MSGLYNDNRSQYNYFRILEAYSFCENNFAITNQKWVKLANIYFNVDLLSSCKYHFIIWDEKSMGSGIFITINNAGKNYRKRER